MDTSLYQEKYLNLINIIEAAFPEKKNKIHFFVKNVNFAEFSKNLCSTINNKKNGKEYLLNTNSKLFTMSKEGVFVNIIGNINFKNLLEKMNEMNRRLVWQNIILLYVLYEIPDNKCKLVEEPLNEEYLTQKLYITNLLDKMEELSKYEVVEVMEECPIDNMIFDIADTFKNVMNAKDSKDSKPPIKELLKTTQLITQKYREKLNNGEITPTDMLATLTRLLQDKDQGTTQINNIFSEKADEKKKKELDDFYNKENLNMSGAFDSLLGDIDTENLDISCIPMLMSEITKKVDNGEIDLKEFEELNLEN